MGLAAFGAGCGDSPQDETDAAQESDTGTDAGTDADQPDADQPDADQPDTDQPDTDQPDPDGGTDGDDNLAPTAAFSVAQTSMAGSAVAFDASASSDPDGEALSYDWDFGDEKLGDGQTIAHIFDDAGDYTVTLTVTDASGQQHSVQETVAVDPRPQPAVEDVGALTISGQVTDNGGAPLESVAVSVLRTNIDGVTDADGHVELSGLDADTKHTVVIGGDGYADQVVVVEAPAGASEAYFETMLLTRSDATTLSDVEAGGATDAGVDGAKLTLPPNALVDANGDPVTGAIDVQMTPVDISGDQILAFPGGFDAVQPDGTSTPILSYGTVEFELSQGGAPLQLAAGKEATILVPIYVTKNENGDDLAAGDSIPLWSLDEASGVWVREGSGTVVASTDSPSGWAMEANVGHFSWWNCDAFFNPYRVNPLPRLRDQSGAATVEFEEGETVLVRGESLADERPRGLASVYVDSSGVDGGLQVPADRDTRLIAYGRNGTLRGEKIVNGAEGALEDIVIALDPIDSGGNGEMVTLPVQRDAAIDPADETDRYTFEATAGDLVRIEVDRAPGSNLAGKVSLYPKGGIRMGVATFGVRPGTIAQRIPADGEYVVEVDGRYNAPGAYSLSVETLTEVQLDTHVTGTFSSNTQEKFFLFEATAGTAVAVGTKAGQATYAYVETIDGDSLTSSLSSTVAEIPSDGVYVLRIENSDPSVMDYEVGLATVESTPLSFTDSRAVVSTAIDVRGDHQVYSFTADAGDGLSVTLRGTGATPLVRDQYVEMRVDRVGTGAFFEPEAQVQNEAGWTSSDYFIDSHLSKLPGSGTDTYVVTVSSQLLGDYELVVDQVAHAAQITVDDDASCSGATTVSLEAALQAIDSGGTVDVCDGVYSPRANVISPTDGVTIEGASQTGVIIESENTGGSTLRINASDVTLRGMTIEHIDDQGIRFNGDNLVFEDLTIRAIDPATAVLDEGISGSGLNPTFRNLTISDAHRGIEHNQPGGAGGVVEDCVISNVMRGLDLEAEGYTVQRNDITARDDGPNTYGIMLSGEAFVVEDNIITVDLMSDSYANGTALQIYERSDSPTDTSIRGNTISYVNENSGQDTMGIEILVNYAYAEPNILIENNDITLKPTEGGTGMRLFCNEHTSINVQNNVVKNLGYKGIVIEGVDQADHLGIYNNSFQQSAIDNHPSSTNDTIRLIASTSTTATSLAVEIVNNIFDANGVGAFGIDFGGGTAGMSIDSDYNLWFGYTSVYVDGTSSTGTHEITGQDPQFQGSMLEVSASSPAVDAGADASLYPGVPTVDFAGVSRPAGAGYDIGAYEQ